MDKDLQRVTSARLRVGDQFRDGDKMYLVTSKTEFMDTYWVELLHNRKKAA